MNTAGPAKLNILAKIIFLQAKLLVDYYILIIMVKTISK